MITIMKPRKAATVVRRYSGTLGTGEEHQVSKVTANSLSKNDDREENLSSLSDAFSVPEEASPSTEEARGRRHGTPPHTQKEWYSKTEAARYLGMAEITITRYLDKGVLHAHRLPTSRAEPRQGGYNYGRLRIHKSELDRYLESVDRNPNEPGAKQLAGEGMDKGLDGTGHDAAARTARTAPMPDTGDELMTRQEAAVRLGVSWRTIKRYIESGELRLAGYFRCSDSYTRAHVFRSDVEQLLHHESLGQSEHLRSTDEAGRTRTESTRRA
jgi:excisionase family DNA binding protein